jgi:hypothetical protein
MTTIILKTWTGKTFTLDVSINSTVDDVKASIVLRGLALDQQRLSSNGVELESGRTLSDYGIVSDDVVSLDSTAADAMVDLLCAAKSIEELAKLNPLSRVVLAQGDAIAAFQIGQKVIPGAPERLVKIAPAFKDLIAYDMTSGDGDNDEEDYFPSRLGAGESELPLKALEGTDLHEYESEIFADVGPQPIECIVKVPCSDVTMVEKEIPKIIPHARECAAEVPHLLRKERMAPISRNVNSVADEPDNDFIASSGLFQRGVALSAFPEWDYHAAALLEVLGLENRPGGRLQPLEIG